MLDEGVESLGAFFFVSLAGYSDSHSFGQVTDTLRPEELVEFGIDAHVSSTHQSTYVLLDSLNRSGRLLFELGAVG